MIKRIRAIYRLNKLTFKFAFLNVLLYSAIFIACFLAVQYIYASLDLSPWVPYMMFLCLLVVVYILTKPAMERHDAYVQAQIDDEQGMHDWLDAVERLAEQYYKGLPNMYNRSEPP